MDLENLEKNLNINFSNKSLLKKAFVHKSYAYENQVESNEKLEFLGDAILELIISEYLYNNYSYLKEGEMTKVRASVVCEESLYEVAKKHNFSDFLKVSKNEYLTKGNEKPAILADSVEAFIAAIFLDLGLDKAKEFIINNLKDSVEVASKHVGMKDYKTVLQEKLQQNGEVKIKYDLIKEIGPDHDKLFLVNVSCDGRVLAEGQGKTKKGAEMEAARKALKEI
mgnify:CR=1 FL=1